MSTKPFAYAQSLVPTRFCEIKRPTDICTEAAKNYEKLEANTIAASALYGVAVHRLADGGYLACQRTFTRHCRDLDELTAFARQTGITT